MKTFLVLLALCLLLRENFPFSHFPMYSKFPSRTTLIYFQDAQGQPVPIQTLTFFRTGRLKKMYNSHLKGIARELDKRQSRLTPSEKEPAGKAVLAHIETHLFDPLRPEYNRHRPLQLVEVEIVLTDGEVERKESVIAREEVELP